MAFLDWTIRLLRGESRGGAVLGFWVLCLFVPLTLLILTHAEAQQTQCAEVQLEIVQELSFERQAFDARMRINNGLTNIPLEHVNIELMFKDEAGNVVVATTDPNNLSALFFYRVEPLIGINDISGAGTLPGNSSAEIHWLIIPGYNSAGNTLQGARYFIGARLTYDINGQQNEVIVTPDFVTVRPQPRLELSYFLPIHVRANDPFTLGVRIKNTGLAPSNHTQIDSAQPRITQNQQGLLVNFQLNGSYVDDEPAQPTLLLDFGTVDAGGARVGRWIMESTLAGIFENFSATWSHLDELGGRLTSLLVDPIQTHRLVHDVMVDLPGRDTVRDFLTNDAGVLGLYESSGVDSAVNNQSSAATFGIFGSSGGVTTYYIDVPPTAGALYVKLPDPHLGSKVVLSARRQADARTLHPQNAWFSAEDTFPTSYFFNLFDVEGGGRYLIDVGDPVQGPAAPTIQFIPNYLVVEGNQLSFIVQATDPNSTVPLLTVDALPVGATFTDLGNGTGQFSWPTTVGQAGHFPVTFRASDGVFSSARTPTLRIASLQDTDDDGMLDAWEIQHFGNLSRDGTGDLDGDGLSDLEEFRRGTDPTYAGNAPSVPPIEAPLFGHTVTFNRPKLSVRNARHGVQVPTYEFQVFKDETYLRKVAEQSGIPERGPTSTWQVPSPLRDNTWYYWRARATLSVASSEWNYGKFFVNLTNDAPSAPIQVFPLAQDLVDGRDVRLTVQNSVDPDGDEVLYGFGVIGTVAGQPQPIIGLGIPAGLKGTTSWVARIPQNMQPPFVWSVMAYDKSLAYRQSGWTPFVVDTTGLAPGAVLPLSPTYGERVSSQSVELVAKGVEDPELRTVSYEVELDAVPSFNSPALRQLSPIVNGLDVRAVHAGLVEDRQYYWRIRPFDGTHFGPWVVSTFRVNATNTAPQLASVQNPELSARVDSLAPYLFVSPAIDSDGDTLRYHFEVYSYQVEGLLNRVAYGDSITTWWQASPALSNHTKYRWRYRAEDSAGAFSPWSEPTTIFVSRDGVDDPPHVRAVAPLNNTSIAQNRSLPFSWADLDSDSNATIKFYLGNILLPPVFTEDLDGANDTIVLPPMSIPPGTYTVNVAIDDGTTEVRDNTCCTFTFTPPSLVDDSDGDGIFDHLDNCPYAFNPAQSDQGGFRSTTPDGRGDACQCGDVDGSGVVDQADYAALKYALDPGTATSLAHPELCNLIADPGCDKQDLAALENALAGPLTPLPATCEAAGR